MLVLQKAKIVFSLNKQNFMGFLNLTLPEEVKD